MTNTADRVSMWRSPDDPVFHPEPAKFSIEDDYAVFQVSTKSWPGGLDADDVVSWPILAHKRNGDGDLELVYEGEIHDVDEQAYYGGTKRTLRCKPAADPQSQFLPGSLQP